MNIQLERKRIIEHFKGEIEEAIETVLENERKYSEELGEEVVSSLGEDTEQWILIDNFDRKYDFFFKLELEEQLEVIPSEDGFYLSIVDTGKDGYVVWLERDETEEHEYFSEELAKIDCGYKRYNTGYAPRYTDTYPYAYANF